MSADHKQTNDTVCSKQCLASLLDLAMPTESNFLAAHKRVKVKSYQKFRPPKSWEKEERRGKRIIKVIKNFKPPNLPKSWGVATVIHMLQPRNPFYNPQLQPQVAVFRNLKKPRLQPNSCNLLALQRNAFAVMTQCETHLPGWQLANEQT